MSTPSVLPRWASPLADTDRFERFCELVNDIAVTRFGRSVARLDPSTGVLRGPDGLVAWLGNLAHSCAGVPASEWRLCIYSFLAWADDLAPVKVLDLVCSWSRIRGLLRVRLLPTGVYGDDFVTRPLGDRACVGLVANLDGNCLPIATDHAEQWDEPIDHAWRIAEANLRRWEGYHQRAYVGHGQVLFDLVGAMFTTGHALRLGELDLGIGSDGALVAAPTARELLVLPISPGPLAEAVAGMLAIAAHVRAEEPNGVSPSLYWYRGDGRLVPAVEAGSDGFRVVAPAAFAGDPEAASSQLRDDAGHEHPGESCDPH